jgi:hypothetical protein
VAAGPARTSSGAEAAMIAAIRTTSAAAQSIDRTPAAQRRIGARCPRLPVTLRRAHPPLIAKGAPDPAAREPSQGASPGR